MIFKRIYWLWLTLGLVFQLVLSVILWSRTSNIPPNFDDSYAYTFAIRKFAETGRLFPSIPFLSPIVHFDYLGYSFLFGFLSRSLDLSPEKIYFFSFFVGKIVLICTIYWWVLCEFGKKNVIPITLIISLFVGTGAIHGWFWVTPSFFSLLAVFWYWSLCTYKSSVLRNLLMFIACLTAITFHPIGSYAIFIYLLSLLVCLYQSRVRVKLDVGVFVLPTLVLLGYWGGRFLVMHTFTFGFLPPESVLSVTSVISSRQLPTTSFLSGLSALWSELLSYFVRFPPILLILPGHLKGGVHISPKFRILFILIFISSVFSTLFLSEGYRTLLLLWIIIYAYFAVSYFEVGFIQKLIIILFIVSVSGWQVLGLWQGKSYNDISIDLSCVNFLKKNTHPSEEVYFTSQSGINAFAAQGLYTRRLISAENINNELGDFLITENYNFEGNSDHQFLTKSNVQQQYSLKDLRNCGFFEIFKIGNKTD